MIKGADINIQPFPIKDLIKNNNIETLSYFIEFSKSNSSIIKPSDLNKFSKDFKEQLFTNNNIKLAAQNEQTEILELLLRNFIINGKTLPIKVAAMDNQILIKVLNFLTTKDILIKGNTSELFETLLYNFINNNSITSVEIEKMLLNIHGLEKGHFLKVSANKVIIKTISNTTSLLDHDKVKILATHIIKYGDENDFNKLKFHELLVK